MCDHDSEENSEYNEWVKQQQFEKMLPVTLRETHAFINGLEQQQQHIFTKKDVKPQNMCKSECKINMSTTFGDQNDDDNNDDASFVLEIDDSKNTNFNELEDLEKTVDEMRMGSILATLKFRKLIQDTIGKPMDSLEGCGGTRTNNTPTNALCF